MNGAGKSTAFLRWQSTMLEDVLDDPMLTTTEKVVALVLVRHADPFGACFPSKRTIQRQASRSDWGLRLAMRGLVRKGRVTKEPRYSLERGDETNLFRVHAKPGGGSSQSAPALKAPALPELPNKKGSGSLDRLSSQLLTPTPQGGSGGGATRGPEKRQHDAPELAEAVHIVAACPDEQRNVGARLARAELHRLSSALLAKGLELGLLVVAAEQYRAKQGPWEKSRTLLHGVTAIADDVAGWAARVERRAKPVARPKKSDATVQVTVMSLADTARAAAAAAALAGVVAEPKIDSKGRQARATGTFGRGQR